LVLSASENTAKIRIRGATKIYESKTGPVHALEDLSVEVREGELVCVLGPSGCGKTTLLWAMSGLHALTRGDILLDGTPVIGPRPQEIGIIFQDANLLPWRNLRQNIEFPFEIKKRPRTGRGSRRSSARRASRSSSARCRVSSRAECSSVRRSCGRLRKTPRSC